MFFKILIVFSYILGDAMIIMGIRQKIGYAIVYGVIMILVATVWVCKLLLERKKRKEMEAAEARRLAKKERKKDKKHRN
ncbi:MAG: hypothetical protein IKX97_01185, partial [Erysipelotrichaceae bacterium]|nr:hypothetical protein [Erysipelotrichaceae bacterium]MBR5754426.1 hypothetical protein [Erysipelotrichaceae bacterium]